MTGDDVIARLRDTPPRSVIRAIPPVIRMLDRHQIDVRPRAARLTAALLPLLGRETLQQSIERLYEQLDRVDPGSAMADDLLARICDLEEREAQQYAQEFDARSPLNKDALDQALDRARSLLILEK